METPISSERKTSFKFLRDGGGGEGAAQEGGGREGGRTFERSDLRKFDLRHPFPNGKGIS